MKNKGELSVFFLITIVLAIAAFIPVLYLLVNFYGGDSLGIDEVCKMSVLTRATAPASAQSYIPLKCSTKKFCLTQSTFGKCKQFAGEENVIRITLPSNKEEAARKIEEVSARAMYDCWQTMGQGKLDLFGSFEGSHGLNPQESACVLCSRVAIDEEIHEDILSLTNINEYMSKNSPPSSSLTYLQLFTDKSRQAYSKVNEKAFTDSLKKEVQREDKSKIELVKEEGPNKEMAIVFMQIKPSSVDEVLSNMLNTGATAAGTTFMTPFVGNIAKRIVFTPVGAGVTVVAAAAVGGYGAYNAKQGQLTAAGYCGNFASNKGGAEKGCSLVQGVNYHFKDINSLCYKIEGNP